MQNYGSATRQQGKRTTVIESHKSIARQLGVAPSPNFSHKEQPAHSLPSLARCSILMPSSLSLTSFSVLVCGFQVCERWRSAPRLERKGS